MNEFSIYKLSTDLPQSFAEILKDRFNIGEISLLNKRKQVVDSTTNYLVKNPKGQNIAFISYSSPISPKQVETGIECSCLAKQVLGLELGGHILAPLAQGKLNGLSYAVLPYCQPLTNSRLGWYAQRGLLSQHWLKWLCDVTEKTVLEVPNVQIEQNFILPLKKLMELEEVSDRLRTEARQAIERLTTGEWFPRYVLMHNDLWKGNILLDHHQVTEVKDKPWAERFLIVDWAGSKVKGYAIYDLIRLAQSVNLGQKQLHNQVAAHCHILGCNLIDARSYLLAALGNLSLKLEHFPLTRFVQMADSCLKTLEQIG